MENQHWQDWVTALVGVCLLLTPLLLPFLVFAAAVPSGIITMNFYFTGLIVLAVGIAALMSYAYWEEVAVIVLGLWLILSPWLLAFSHLPALAATALISGTIIVVVAAWALVDEQRAEPL